jgi:hypothetical protein
MAEALRVEVSDCRATNSLSKDVLVEPGARLKNLFNGGSVGTIDMPDGSKFTVTHVRGDERTEEPSENTVLEEGDKIKISPKKYEGGGFFRSLAIAFSRRLLG